MLVHTENRCRSNLRIRHINPCVKRYSIRSGVLALPPCLVDLSNEFCYSIPEGAI
jgi:hypothetical protein